MDANVDGIKVGIGPGSICTETHVAGTGIPREPAHDCAATNIPRGASQIVDAAVSGYQVTSRRQYTTGADTVMMGSMFPGTNKAPGKVIAIQGASIQRAGAWVAWCYEQGPVKRPVTPGRKGMGSTKFVRRHGTDQRVCRARGRGNLHSWAA